MQKLKKLTYRKAKIIMPDQNQSKNNQSTSGGKSKTNTPGGTAAGMQISGEQIFHETDQQVDTHSSTEQDVQAAFGSGSTGQTGAQSSGGGQGGQSSGQVSTQV